MTMNTQGRPTTPDRAAASPATAAFTGNRGLDHEEALIFESGRLDVTGVDLPEPKRVKSRLGGLAPRRRLDETNAAHEPKLRWKRSA